MQGENVIKVGSDRYWGFGVADHVKTYEEWRAELAEAYFGRTPTAAEIAGVPGWGYGTSAADFRPVVRFFRVNDVGQKIFDDRRAALGP